MRIFNQVTIPRILRWPNNQSRRLGLDHQVPCWTETYLNQVALEVDRINSAQFLQQILPRSFRSFYLIFHSTPFLCIQFWSSFAMKDLVTSKSLRMRWRHCFLMCQTPIIRNCSKWFTIRWTRTMMGRLMWTSWVTTWLCSTILRAIRRMLIVGPRFLRWIGLLWTMWDPIFNL